LPAALTGDVVGRVTGVGPGVTSAAVGDRVATLSEEAAADYVVADATWLVSVPEEADAAEATVLAMIAPLARGLLHAGRLTTNSETAGRPTTNSETAGRPTTDSETAGRPTTDSETAGRLIAEGETVLVQSAAGGVGHLVVQLALILGAGRVIGTASTEVKRDFVRSLGAEAVASTDPDWAARVRELAPGGVDIVLDSVGGATFDSGVELLAPLGRMVTYGAIGGTVPTVAAHSLFALKYVAGFSMLAWRAARPEQARADMTEVAELFAAGRLRSVVHARLPLADAAKAHEILDARANAGRVVLTP
jgi:NADPH:quinone reductase-like Zn-dependent oxidoreductase